MEGLFETQKKIALKFRDIQNPKLDKVWPHFVISGQPGVGKTFLLKYLSKEHHALYVDLDERGGDLQFWYKLKDRIDRDEPEILIIDHVPRLRLDDSLRGVQERVLEPFADKGGMIVASICGFDKWSLTQPMHDLHELLLPEVMEIQQLYSNQADCNYVEKDVEELIKCRNPLLTKYLCEKSSVESACRGFLMHWLRRMEEEGERLNNQLISLAEEDVLTLDIIGRKFRSGEEAKKIHSFLRRVHWIGGKEEPDKWVGVVSRCLKILGKAKS